MQCCMRPKDGSTALPQASAAEGRQEGPRKGVCPLSSKALGGEHRFGRVSGRCDSCGLDPERQKDHCILEASGPGLHPGIVP